MCGMAENRAMAMAAVAALENGRSRPKMAVGVEYKQLTALEMEQRGKHKAQGSESRAQDWTQGSDTRFKTQILTRKQGLMC